MDRLVDLLADRFIDVESFSLKSRGILLPVAAAANDEGKKVLIFYYIIIIVLMQFISWLYDYQQQFIYECCLLCFGH